MSKNIESIVNRLKKASIAYYETGIPIMTDDEYDEQVEELRELAPDHPYFSLVGAPVSEGAVRLPIVMPSLRKVKPDSIDAWAREYKGPWVVSDKLDGISALWIPSTKSLYLRGDGLVGQDVSHLVPLGIQGLKKANCLAVRGELIVPKGMIQGTIARSWVNGQLHQKTPLKADISKIQFIAYSVYTKEPMTRSLQMAWFVNNGFITVPNSIIDDVRAFGNLLKERRSIGHYDIDGLVLGQADTKPDVLGSTAALPRDMVAFKMPLEDQKARAQVVAVHWASSMGNRWIPRIEIKPVVIGSATITYATGHNAKFIYEKSIGPGAVIIIRRSGDVIPTIEDVVTPAENPSMPSGAWEWDSNGTHALDTRGTVNVEKQSLFIVDSLVVFGIEGVSTKNAIKLAEAGYGDLKKIWDLSEAELIRVIGNALGVKLYEQLHNKIITASPEQWILAYQGWPRGFGKARVAAFLELGGVSDWPALKTLPKGIGYETFQAIIVCVPAYLDWRAGFGYVTTKLKKPVPVPVPVQVPVQVSVQVQGAVCMTGFRDKDLEAKLKAHGWSIHDTVKRDTTVLIVADETKMGSTKVADAQKKGVRIILRNDAGQLLSD